MGLRPYVWELILAPDTSVRAGLDGGPPGWGCRGIGVGGEEKRRGVRGAVGPAAFSRLDAKRFGTVVGPRLAWRMNGNEDVD